MSGASNPGKAFERDFIRSVPRDTYQYRLRDCGGWAQGGGTRFTPTNDYDMYLYQAPTLYTLELKSTASASMRYDELTDVQEKGLLNSARFRGVCSGVIVNFRNAKSDTERTFYISIFDWIAAKKRSKKKSFNAKEAEQLGVEIPGERKREGARYTWDIRTFTNTVRCCGQEDVAA